MRSILAALIATLTFSASGFSQSSPGPKLFDGAADLISHVVLFPRPQKGKPAYITAENYAKFRFDLLTFKNGCTSFHCISYGARLGKNWDIFTIGSGQVNRTRMVSIGKRNWSDQIMIPYVEPWAALAPGERRTVTFDTSGGSGLPGSNGPNGINGTNADGSTVAVLEGESTSFPTIPTADKSNAQLSGQVSSQVVGKDGKRRADRYTPVIEVKEGHMYVARLKDDKIDQFVVIRVDELKRGEKVVISYKRLEVPKSIF